MNIDTKFEPNRPASTEFYAAAVRADLTRLAPLTAKLSKVDQALAKLEQLGDQTTTKSAARLRAKLGNTEPSVTMIGQVKSGKTSLVNAMIGWPELLPADVNPWTSVVTSLHLNPKKNAAMQKAKFQFFNNEEWAHLVLNGGRVGELAGRAGAENEVAKVQRQIAEMQEKSRNRLGRKFELLLGQQHEYEQVDSHLVERYVCLGDDFEDNTETSKTQGRFADITKSADLHIHQPEIPMPLCIRDTPGVNDTFMVREQITIRAIRDSRICVVVLSAHQALSSVDMALIRMITNVKSREVIIFVNRIDELSDPARQVREIRDSIKATLRSYQGPEDAQIIFGSAYWANNALQNFQGGAAKDSMAALENWAAASDDLDANLGRQETAWKLSGLPQLFDAIAERIVEGDGSDLAESVASDARNLALGTKASNAIAELLKDGAPRPEIDLDELSAALTRITENGDRLVEQEFGKLLGDFSDRIDRSHRSFLQRATAALINHMEEHGEMSSWKYDPTGLRLLFRSSYQTFAKRATDLTHSVFAMAAKDLTGLYRKLQLIDDPAFSLEAPRAPWVAPPVLLGQTIALDLQSNWWARWWRKRRGLEAYAEEFSALIQAETDPMAQSLKTDHVAAIRKNAADAFSEFVQEQSDLLRCLAAQTSGSPDNIRHLKVHDTHSKRQALLAEVFELLGPPKPDGDVAQ